MSWLDDGSEIVTANLNARPAAPRPQPAAPAWLDQGSEVVAPANLPSFGKGMLNSAVSGLSFGYDDEISAGVKSALGMVDDYDKEVKRQRTEKAAFREAHPYWAAAGEVAGSLPTLAIPGLGVSGNALKAARATQSLGGYVKEGAKAGAKFGALGGSGDAKMTEGGGLVQAAIDRLSGAAKGAGEGLVLGGGVGTVVGAGTRVIPALDGVRDILRSMGSGTRAEQAVERAGLSAIRREGLRDGVDYETVMNRLVPEYVKGGSLSLAQRQSLLDGHMAGRSAGEIAADLSRSGRPVSEASVRTLTKRFDDEVRPSFEGQNILETLRTPSAKGEIIVTPNVTDLAQVSATTEGAGRQRAMQRIRQRQANQADEIEGAIDRQFGSANFDEAAQIARETRRGQARVRYEQLHAGQTPVLALDDPAVAHLVGDPVFQNALAFAQRHARANSLPFDVSQGLTPSAIDQIQRQLRASSKSLTDPNAANLSGSIRDQFLKIADQRMPDFFGTRGFYRNAQAADEALEMGRKLGPKNKNSGSEEFAFFRDHSNRLRQNERAVAAVTKQLRSPSLKPAERVSLQDQLDGVTIMRDQAAEIVSDFKAGFGQSLKDALDKGKNADQFLGAAASREFKRRIVEILGSKNREAAAFIGLIAKMNRMKDTTGHLYGNSATAARSAKQGQLDSIMNVAAGIATLNPGRAMRGVGDAVSNTMRERRANVVNDVLSETDLPEVYRLLNKLRSTQRQSQLPGRFDLPDSLTSLPQTLQNRIRSVTSDEVRGNDLVPVISAVGAGPVDRAWEGR